MLSIGRLISAVAVLAIGLGLSPAGAQTIDATNELPQNAKAGECYARVLVPETYRTETESVLKSEASERIEIVPARYEWIEESVLTKEASTRIEIVPARYEWVEERVVVKPQTSDKQEVAAKYSWSEEQVLVKPARTVWKKGRGPIERVDGGTGEIMCLVEEPAVYKTVRKRVLSQPANTVEVEVPAEYKTIKKQVLVEPTRTREVEVPAEYTSVKVRRLVSPASEKRIPIAAEYDTVTKQVPVSEPRVEWRPVLCQTNLGSATVIRIQRALKEAGHEPGPIDGVIGSETMRAVNAFQRSKGLSEGALTLEALEALQVRTN